MIIIDSSLNVKILKHISLDGDKSLVLTKNLSNEEISIDSSVIDKSFYYKAFIPELNEGEYTYYVKDSSNNVLETGLLYYGKMNEIDSSIKEYTTENKVYVYERK